MKCPGIWDSWNELWDQAQGLIKAIRVINPARHPIIIAATAKPLPDHSFFRPLRNAMVARTIVTITPRTTRIGLVPVANARATVPAAAAKAGTAQGFQRRWGSSICCRRAERVVSAAAIPIPGPIGGRLERKEVGKGGAVDAIASSCARSSTCTTDMEVSLSWYRLGRGPYRVTCASRGSVRALLRPPRSTCQPGRRCRFWNIPSPTVDRVPEHPASRAAFSTSHRTWEPEGTAITAEDRRYPRTGAFTKANVSPSKRPRSLIFRWGITSKAMKERVMNGAPMVLPSSLAAWSMALYALATS